MTTYRTDISGTVIATSEGKDITVATDNKMTDKVDSTTTNNTTVKKQEAFTTQPITKTGEKYYKNGCSSLGKSVVTISLQDVRKR